MEVFVVPTTADSSKPVKLAAYVCQEPPRPASERLAATKLVFASHPLSRSTPTRSAERLEVERDIAT